MMDKQDPQPVLGVLPSEPSAQPGDSTVTEQNPSRPLLREVRVEQPGQPSRGEGPRLDAVGRVGEQGRSLHDAPRPYQVVSCVRPRVPSLSQSGGWFHRPHCPEQEAVLFAAREVSAVAELVRHSLRSAARVPAVRQAPPSLGLPAALSRVPSGEPPGSTCHCSESAVLTLCCWGDYPLACFVVGALFCSTDACLFSCQYQAVRMAVASWPRLCQAA